MKQRSRTEGQKLVNKSLTNASLRSLRLLESQDEEGSSRSAVVEENMPISETEKEGLQDEDGLNEEEAKPVVDQLHMSYLKKVMQKTFQVVYFITGSTNSFLICFSIRKNPLMTMKRHFLLVS